MAEPLYTLPPSYTQAIQAQSPAQGMVLPFGLTKMHLAIVAILAVLVYFYMKSSEQHKQHEQAERQS